VTIEPEKLAEYERPVVFSSGHGDNVWHVPEVEAGEVTPICGRRSDHQRITSLSLFNRRRNPRKCEACQERTETDEYPEDAPIQREPA